MTKVKRSERDSSAGSIKRRRPHNAGTGEEFGSLDDLVRKIGAERTTVTINGEERKISRVERSIRLLIHRALGGNRRDLAHLLRLMKSNPRISSSHRERFVTIIRGAMADV
jgi:hypothetical protein